MIELKHVYAGYRGRQVLQDVSLKWKRGCFTAIIGPNGSGKTTLLKTAAVLLKPTAGKIVKDHVDLLTMSPRERARAVSYLAQSVSMPETIVSQTVLYGRYAHSRYPAVYTKKDREIALEAMVRMGVDRYAELRMSELSGGMRQNVYLAMALAQQSDMILLDEPTTYLDISHRLRLMQCLCELSAEGKGVVAVLHDLPLAMEFADEVIVLCDGTVCDVGTPDELFMRGVVDRVFDVTLKRMKDENGTSYYFANGRA